MTLSLMHPTNDNLSIKHIRLTSCLILNIFLTINSHFQIKEINKVNTENLMADTIYQRVKTMPRANIYEVFDFIEFLNFKQTRKVSMPTDNKDLLNFIQNLPKGNRDVVDINQELQILRDEWGQP